MPQYSTEDFTTGVDWKDHGKAGLDTWVHYFEDKDGREVVLLREDFPGNEYLSDDLTHDVVPVPGSESTALQVIFNNKWIPNISGYFTLYKERDRT